jgi:hypothetical protein
MSNPTRAFLVTLAYLTGLAVGPAPAPAAPADAVVQLPAQGGSGTVVWTGPGKTYILTAGHMFSGHAQGQKVQVVAPDPRPGSPRAGGAPRCVGVDASADLALVEMQAGPLPYVCPIAPAGHRPGRLLSVGYDEMRWPAQQRPAHLLHLPSTGSYTLALECGLLHGYLTPRREILQEDGRNFLLTQELPWHGRSGGGLIDVDSGYLIGVVSGYRGTDPDHWRETKPGCAGVYGSTAAIQRFVAQYAPQVLQSPYRYQPPAQPYYWPQQALGYQYPYSYPYQNPYQYQYPYDYRYYQQPGYGRAAPYCPPGGT